MSVTATAPGGSTVQFGPSNTASDGTYQLDVSAGTYDIHFDPPSGSGLAPFVEGSYVVSGNQVLSLQLSQATHTLSGFFRDQLGNPISGAGIYLTAADGNHSHTVTAADGSYSISAVADVYNDLTALLSDGTTIDGFGSFDLTGSDLTQNLQVALVPLTITVRDGNGNPVAGAPISNIPAGGYIAPLLAGSNIPAQASQFVLGGIANAFTDASGNFTNANVPQGLTFPSNSIRAVINGATVTYAPSLTINSPTTIVLQQPVLIPPAPANLVAASPTQNPALSWNASAGATSYNVFCNGSKVASSSSTSYLDNAAPQGNDTYWVTAVNSSGESGPSNSIIVLVDKTPPIVTSASFGINPKPVTQPSDTLSAQVTDPANPVASGIASVQYFDPVLGGWFPMTLSGSTASVSISMPAATYPAGTYTFQVRATDRAGNGATPVSVILTITNAGGSSTCGGLVSGGTITGNVTVQPGSTCNLTSVTVTGNVTVPAGGTLVMNGGSVGNVTSTGGNIVMFGTTVNGNIKMSGGGYLILDGVTVTGNVFVLQVQGLNAVPPDGTPNRICRSTVGNNLSIKGDSVGIVVGDPFGCGSGGGNTVGANLTIANNVVSSGYSALVSYNTVSGNLSCSGNTPVASGVAGSNTVTGLKKGECAGL